MIFPFNLVFPHGVINSICLKKWKTILNVRGEMMKILTESLRFEQNDSISQRNGSTISLLQEIQERYNYLPEEVLRDLAKERNLSLMDLYSIATFYKSFSLSPKGRHKVKTCTGTACHVRGSEKVTEEISRILGIKPGSTSEDGEYSLETVNCLGACALAPLVEVDGEYLSNMTPSRIREILEKQIMNNHECQCTAKVRSAASAG
jgi:NADH:ubiquinone oxidoreductase subunit E